LRLFSTLVLAVVALLASACGSPSTGDEETSSSTSTETTSTSPPVGGSFTVTGAARGTFETVTDCSTTRGNGSGLIVALAGTLGGASARLTFDQDTFATGAYEYPAASPPLAGTELRSDILFDDYAANPRTWQLYPTEPAGQVGRAGGSIDVEASGKTLDVTVDARYGTTDKAGPVRVKGEVRCRETA
jgi:hypothetical protein